MMFFHGKDDFLQ